MAARLGMYSVLQTEVASSALALVSKQSGRSRNHKVTNRGLWSAAVRHFGDLQGWVQHGPMDCLTSAHFPFHSGHSGFMKLLRIHVSELYTFSFCLRGFTRIWVCSLCSVKSLVKSHLCRGTFSDASFSALTVSSSCFPALCFISSHTQNLHYDYLYQNECHEGQRLLYTAGMGNTSLEEKTASILGLENHSFIYNYSSLLLSNWRGYKNKRALMCSNKTLFTKVGGNRVKDPHSVCWSRWNVWKYNWC